MFVRLRIYFVFGSTWNMDLFLKLRETFCHIYVKVPTTFLNYRLVFSLAPKRDVKGEDQGCDFIPSEIWGRMPISFDYMWLT